LAEKKNAWTIRTGGENIGTQGLGLNRTENRAQRGAKRKGNSLMGKGSKGRKGFPEGEKISEEKVLRNVVWENCTRERLGNTVGKGDGERGGVRCGKEGNTETSGRTKMSKRQTIERE